MGKNTKNPIFPMIIGELKHDNPLNLLWGSSSPHWDGFILGVNYSSEIPNGVQITQNNRLVLYKLNSTKQQGFLTSCNSKALQGDAT